MLRLHQATIPLQPVPHFFLLTIMAASHTNVPSASDGTIMESNDATVPFARIVQMNTWSHAPWDNATDVSAAAMISGSDGVG